MLSVKSNTPVAVLISDIHYNLQNLELANKSLGMAVDKANELNVSVIIAGDLHDTKANIRGECLNAILNTLSKAHYEVIILRGNHDSINEKSEESSLSVLDRVEYLGDDEIGTTITVINYPRFTNKIAVDGKSLQFIPYQHNPDKAREFLKRIDKGSCIIMHQGLRGSNAGEYIQDKSALNYEDVADFRVISGHYHTRQDIKCRKENTRTVAGDVVGSPLRFVVNNQNVGVFSYIGNPYTVNFGEANDPTKGFQILYSDGRLEFVPTNLRKHVVIECNFEDCNNDGNFNILNLPSTEHVNEQDIVRVKVKGPKEQLSKYTKLTLGKFLKLSQDFSLDLIPTDSARQSVTIQNQTKAELLDSIIDSLTNTSDECKERLKTTWKDLT